MPQCGDRCRGCPQARMSAHDPHVHAGASGRGTLRGETRERLCLTLRTNIQLNIHARARLRRHLPFDRWFYTVACLRAAWSKNIVLYK